MKKIILVTILFISNTPLLKAQNTGVTMAQKIAEKMKDSLFLTDNQEHSIYQINIELFKQKMELWKLNSSKDSLRLYLQTLENKRDPLYQNVLTKDEYLQYKQKKNSLISVNN